MYKIFRLFTVVFAAFALCACQKDIVFDSGADIMLSETDNLILKQEGETQTIAFPLTTGDWTVEPNSYAAWLTAQKIDGNLVVTALPNEQADERFTQISLNLGKEKKAISVTQFGKEPYISIANNNGTVIFNHDAHAGEILKVIANTDNWTVEQVDKDNTWLTYKVDTKSNTLTLSLKSVERGSQWEQTSRTEKLFLTNGNKHYMLNVIQNGYLQFQFPVWELDKPFDIERLTELESTRNNLRDKDFEKDELMPKGEDSPKAYYVFNSAGEQAPKTLYQMDYYTKLVSAAYMKAPAGKTFKEESLAPWLSQNGFKKGNKQQNDTETEYYCEKPDRTLLVHVFNDAKSRATYGVYTSANIKYVESSNKLRLKEDYYGENIISCFPVDNIRLNDKSFTLQQVIEFEKSRGMVPDYENKLNKAVNDPHCKYAYLVFKQEQDHSEPGALLNVIYSFNWVGATVEDLDQGVSNDPNLSGTVGRRQDVIAETSILYRAEEMGWSGSGYYKYRLRAQGRSSLEDKGYRFVRDDDSGFATFVRGEEDLIDVYPQTRWVVIAYYKSKKFVDQINEWLNK